MNSLLQFLLYPNFTGWLLVIKIIFLGFAFYFLGMIINFLVTSSWLKRAVLWDLKEFLTYRAYETKRYGKKWATIKKRLNTGFESEAKLSLIEAETILEEILKNMGYEGESLGERLEKLTTDVIENLEEIKEAHKIKNDIIHDPTYKLSIDEAKKLLVVYEQALEDLGSI